MKTNRNKGMLALLRFRFFDSLKGAAAFIAVITTVMAVLIAMVNLSYNISVKGSAFSGFSIAAAISLFVFGICTIRDDLRIGIQNGTSRKSVMLAEVVAMFAVVALTAISGEILNTICAAISDPEKLAILDIYQMMFMQGSLNSGAVMNFGQHLMSILINTAIMLFTYSFGAFFSLLFYRLNKLFKVIVGVSLPFIISNVLPMIVLLLYSTTIGKAVFDSAIRTPSVFLLVVLLLAFISFSIDYLLIRRAPVKGAAA